MLSAIIPVSMIENLKTMIHDETNRAALRIARGVDAEVALERWHELFNSLIATLQDVEFIKSQATGYKVQKEEGVDDWTVVPEYGMAAFIATEYGIGTVVALDGAEYQEALDVEMEKYQKEIDEKL